VGDELLGLVVVETAIEVVEEEVGEVVVEDVLELVVEEVVEIMGDVVGEDDLDVMTCRICQHKDESRFGD
jgi:hypothetical protein